jgi:hypothetical protein
MASLLDDCEQQVTTNFFGPNQIVDEEDLSEPAAISSRNTGFNEGMVQVPRKGFDEVWNPAAKITTLYNWIQQQYNRLIYLNRTAGTVVSRDLATSTNTTVVASAAVAVAFAQAGYRLYMAFFNATAGGVSQAKVWDGTLTTGVPNIEAVFQRPLNTSDLTGSGNWGTFTEPLAGTVTAGEHFFALVITTWNGYQTAPGPLDSGSTLLIPESFTSAGSKNLQLVINPATVWPSWVNTVQLAMTPVANPDRWFLVPQAVATVARGTNFTVTYTVDLDDATLVGEATEITNTLFDLYHQATSGGGPTSPHFICGYGTRTVYLTRFVGPDGLSLIGTILISDPAKPQYIILGENDLNLPEGRDCLTAFVLGNTLYVCGPSWTYAISDNKQTPTNWGEWRLIDGAIGSPFIKGVQANPTAGYAWVADHNGLFYFTGSTFRNVGGAAVPASYEQTPDWNRINFAAAQDTLEVIDDSRNRIVMVKCALDGATVATHILAWDYTNGTQIGQIKYCGPWCIGSYSTAVSAPTYGVGALAVVQNQTTKIKEVWIARGDAAGNVKRQKSIEAGDATTTDPSALYDDDNLGIDGAYNFLAVSQAQNGVQQQVGAHVRLRGMGQVNITARSLDQLNPIELAPISASDNSMTPGRRWLRTMNKQSECCSYEFDNGATVGAFFYLAVIQAYFKPWLRER